MPLDGVTAMHIATELNQRLNGGRVDKIGQPGRYALLLSIRQNGRTHRLLLDANPQAPQIGLIATSLPNPEQAPHFTMLLRKHLLGAELEAVECFDYERVFFLRFQARNEMGDHVRLSLIAELMGRHSNLVLINKDERIVAAVRHIDSRVNRVRETLPAHPYVAPPRQQKRLPADMLAFLQKGGTIFADTADSTAERIVRSTAGFSPFLAAEVAYLADTGDRPLAELSEAERRLAAAVFETLLRRILNDAASPTLYLDPKTGAPQDFHAFNLTYRKEKEDVSDIFAAMARVAARTAADAAFLEQKRQLQKRLSARLALAERRVTVHAAEVSEGRQADTYRQYGDLLYAYLHLVPEQAETVTLPDFATDEPVTIRLDPHRTAAKNAERYYRLYRKAKTKLEMAGRLLAKDIGERDYLLSLTSALALAAETDDLDALAEEMTLPAHAAGSDRDRREPAGQPGRPASRKRRSLAARQAGERKKKAAAKPPDERPNYRRFISSTGHTILVGRNNLQNDRLTLREAARDDLWLHVHQAPGSHVIVQGALEDLPDAAVLEAAGLAAWFSSLNKGTGSPVDVDYCPAGRVKKGSGQKPGQVIYEGYYQVRVAPLDPASLRPDDAP